MYFGGGVAQWHSGTVGQWASGTVAQWAKINYHGVILKVREKIMTLVAEVAEYKNLGQTLFTLKVWV